MRREIKILTSVNVVNEVYNDTLRLLYFVEFVNTVKDLLSFTSDS